MIATLGQVHRKLVGFFARVLSIQLRHGELLLQLEVVHLERLRPAVRLPLLQLNLLDQHLLLFQFFLGFVDLFGHEFDLFPHCKVADFLSLLDGEP